MTTTMSTPAPPRVLVCDDYPEFCDELREPLEAMGLDVTVCHSPLQTLEMLGNETFDLLITGLVIVLAAIADVWRGRRS